MRMPPIPSMSDRLHINHAYNILGLKPGASHEDMKQAYRKLVKTWHPDCFPDQKHKQEAEEKSNKSTKLTSYSSLEKQVLLTNMLK